MLAHLSKVSFAPTEAAATEGLRKHARRECARLPEGRTRTCCLGASPLSERTTQKCAAPENELERNKRVLQTLEGWGKMREPESLLLLLFYACTLFGCLLYLRSPACLPACLLARAPPARQPQTR